MSDDPRIEAVREALCEQFLMPESLGERYAVAALAAADKAAGWEQVAEGWDYRNRTEAGWFFSQMPVAATEVRRVPLYRLSADAKKCETCRGAGTTASIEERVAGVFRAQPFGPQGTGVPACPTCGGSGPAPSPLDEAVEALAALVEIVMGMRWSDHPRGKPYVADVVKPARVLLARLSVEDTKEGT